MPEPEDTRPTMLVQISNFYACGRESNDTVDVPAPDGESRDNWWDHRVFQHTGDGHPCGAGDDAVHLATIVEAPGRPDLVGRERSWQG